MARAGMALRRGANQGNADSSGDDVQRSIELLDQVLSEFDDVENANQVQNITTSTSTPHQRRRAAATPPRGRSTTATPDDESPSLGGHQSEDDGYMSMNGRKAKFNLSFKPLAEHRESPPPPAALSPHQLRSPTTPLRPGDPDDFPPPPEEARRLIATLLPKVSPTHRPTKPHNGGGGGAGRNHHRSFPLTQLPLRMETIPPPQRFQNDHNAAPIIINGLPPDPIHTATQTTLPKTKHQRPFGWEHNDFTLNPPPPPPGYRFGSLPYQHGVYPITSPTRMPPRTVPTVVERHREVKRHGSEDNLSSDLDETSALRPLSELADDEHFSDDSLEEMPPPPPPPPVCDKRASIAWEVPLDDDALLTPGSTKVIGRRRRKSGSCSSTSSIPNRLKELEDWPDPPPCTTEDEVTSPFSDSDEHVVLPPELGSANVSGSSTFVIRKVKDRKSLQASLTSNSSLNSRLSSELSLPTSRFSGELSHLHTPNSRYSVDLGAPHSRLSQEFNSPKSRLSLDLNNTRLLSHEPGSSPSGRSASSSRSSTPGRYDGETRKHSTTFDNIKSLVRDGVVHNLVSPTMETARDFGAAVSPMVRVVSLPSLGVDAEEFTPKRELDVTVEEEEEVDSSQPSAEISPLRKIEQNISELLERRDIEVVQNDQFVLNGVESLIRDKKSKPPSKPTRDTRHRIDLQKSNSHSEIQKSEEYYRQLLIEVGGIPFPKRNGIQKSESAKEMLIAHRERDARPLPTSTSADFPVRVEVLSHDFPPLPPSPVEEDEDEYTEILHPVRKSRADTLPNANEPPAVPAHHLQTVSNSLKTRSMDGNYSRGRRTNFFTSSSRNVPPERRTLPTEFQEKRRPFQKRASQQSPQDEHHLQTSCSLPETPIFARGCDIPRTPHRRAPDVPGNQTAPRQSNTIGSLSTIGTTASSGGCRRGLSQTGLEQAIAGAELLRLAGGPGRGWYPKQRHRRPASIEHLDRTTAGANPWGGDGTGGGRKPQTLPPNLTPKFFQRSPRDALRRVTSLLIKKVSCFVPGNNGKEKEHGKKEKEIVSPTIHENANGEEVQKKKGFFKNFWKRSRHYSLEQQ
ncbi:unnamed protein product [Phyllotreta striolata]|uniref:Uncharacterized protein n=1 Tax=Phyllotreta striolata TaxID=444603 RepID=A0A9N9TWM8_PHYSR|nr:unnamed protein product [Phyllotreta striolata]